MYIYLSTYLSVYLSVYISFTLSRFLSLSLSLSLYIYIYTYIYCCSEFYIGVIVGPCAQCLCDFVFFFVCSSWLYVPFYVTVLLFIVIICYVMLMFVNIGSCQDETSKRQMPTRCSKNDFWFTLRWNICSIYMHS